MHLHTESKKQKKKMQKRSNNKNKKNDIRIRREAEAHLQTSADLLSPSLSTGPNPFPLILLIFFYNWMDIPLLLCQLLVCKNMITDRKERDSIGDARRRKEKITVSWRFTQISKPSSSPISFPFLFNIKIILIIYWRLNFLSPEMAQVAGIDSFAHLIFIWFFIFLWCRKKKLKKWIEVHISNL